MFSIVETEARRRGEKVAPIFRHVETSLCLKQLPAVPAQRRWIPAAGLSSAASCSDGNALSPRRPAPQPLAPRGSRATETWLVRLTDGSFHFISE